MAGIKIFATQGGTQHHVKTKFHDNQVLGQYVKRSHSSSHL